MNFTALHLEPKERHEALDAACERILEIQTRDGAIAWFEGGPWDPWNHTECVMALFVAGQRAAGLKSLDYLVKSQLEDGSWLGEYGNALPMVDNMTMARTKAPAFHDTNFAAYCAVGVWHAAQFDDSVLQMYWPMIEKAMAFVMSLQTDAGDILWSLEATTCGPKDAVLAGNSSIYKSMEAALLIADKLNVDASHIKDSRDRLGHALRHRPDLFDRDEKDRSEFAMDWYYPALCGALDKATAIQRLNDGWSTFVATDRGCKCVSSEPWVTVAETCELALTLASVDQTDIAKSLLKAVMPYRTNTGSFWMGWQYEEKLMWPQETPSWTQAAYILAVDALYALSPASRVLIDHD